MPSLFLFCSKRDNDNLPDIIEPTHFLNLQSGQTTDITTGSTPNFKSISTLDIDLLDRMDPNYQCYKNLVFQCEYFSPNICFISSSAKNGSDPDSIPPLYLGPTHTIDPFTLIVQYNKDFISPNPSLSFTSNPFDHPVPQLPRFMGEINGVISPLKQNRFYQVLPNQIFWIGLHIFGIFSMVDLPKPPKPKINNLRVNVNVVPPNPDPIPDAKSEDVNHLSYQKQEKEMIPFSLGLSPKKRSGNHEIVDDSQLFGDDEDEDDQEIGSFPYLSDSLAFDSLPNMSIPNAGHLPMASTGYTPVKYNQHFSIPEITPPRHQIQSTTPMTLATQAPMAETPLTQQTFVPQPEHLRHGIEMETQATQLPLHPPDSFMETQAMTAVIPTTQANVPAKPTSGSGFDEHLSLFDDSDLELSFDEENVLISNDFDDPGNSNIPQAQQKKSQQSTPTAINQDETPSSSGSDLYASLPNSISQEFSDSSQLELHEPESTRRKPNSYPVNPIDEEEEEEEIPLVEEESPVTKSIDAPMTSSTSISHKTRERSEEEEESEQEESQTQTRSESEEESEEEEEVAPIILLTGIKSKHYPKFIKTLGGTVTEDPLECTHVIMGTFKRTSKLLRALCQGASIVSEKWIIDSHKKKSFLPEDKYILNDDSGVSLKDAISRAQNNSPIFSNYFASTVGKFPTKGPQPKDINELFVAGGGTFIDILPNEYYRIKSHKPKGRRKNEKLPNLEKLLLFIPPDDKKTFEHLKKNTTGAHCFEVEGLLSSLLEQEFQMNSFEIQKDFFNQKGKANQKGKKTKAIRQKRSRK